MAAVLFNLLGETLEHGTILEEDATAEEPPARHRVDRWHGEAERAV